MDECRQTPDVCVNGRCENNMGSYSCVCRPGFRLEGNICKGEQTVRYWVKHEKEVHLSILLKRVLIMEIIHVN